jgi:hypothetical protein
VEAGRGRISVRYLLPSLGFLSWTIQSEHSSRSTSTPLGGDGDSPGALARHPGIAGSAASGPGRAVQIGGRARTMPIMMNLVVEKLQNPDGGGR